MTDLPLLPDGVVDEARTGVWCPKLCTFACPVHAATGRDDAVPWSFHRDVADLVDGRRSAGEVAEELVACTGCLACRAPCDLGQDVAAQVRAARAVAPPTTPASTEVLDQLAAGAQPDGTVRQGPDRVVAGATVLHAGCHDPAEVVDAAARLLAAAGHEVEVVADGCCGALATDLGDVELAADRRAHRATQLAGAARVVALDPHCAPSLPADLEVTDLWRALDGVELAFEGPPATVAYHDPCLLARRDGVVDAPRRLLAAAGLTVVEPEHARHDTACSGAGMGLPLLDEAAAAATAHRRAGHLAAAGADRVASACSRACQRLRAAGTTTDDLAVLLADRLPETT